jgi:hypothetical protein
VDQRRNSNVAIVPYPATDIGIHQVSFSHEH